MAKQKAVEAPAPVLAIVPPLKLNLGAGRSKMDGFLAVDALSFPGVDIVADLTKRWPWADDTVDEAHCAVAGQKVDTPSGPVPIERVRVGDLVRGVSGFVRVLATMRRSYSGPVLRLACPEGAPVVTVDHPIATPSGWIEAHKLRHGSVIFSDAAKIQGAKSVDRIHVGARVGTFSASSSDGASSVAVLHAPPAESDYDLGLFGFAGQIRQDLLKKGNRLREVALDKQGQRLLAPWPSGAAPLGGTRGLALLNKDHGAIDNRRVRVRDRNVRLDLWATRDAQGYRPFSVEQAGQVGGFGGSKLHAVSIQHFVGDVYNLHTSDETFFLEGVLTHNCSHFLEHLELLERVNFFNELYRVLKVGAKCQIIIPHWANNRAYGDPTHKWPPVSEMAFFYIRREWRNMNAPHTDARNVPGMYSCDFDASWGHTWDPNHPDMLGRHDDHRAYALRNYRDVAVDLVCTVTKRGPSP